MTSEAARAAEADEEAAAFGTELMRAGSADTDTEEPGPVERCVMASHLPLLGLVPRTAPPKTGVISAPVECIRMSWLLLDMALWSHRCTNANVAGSIGVVGSSTRHHFSDDCEPVDIKGGRGRRGGEGKSPICSTPSLLPSCEKAAACVPPLALRKGGCVGDLNSKPSHGKPGHSTIATSSEGTESTTTQAW